MKKLLVLFSLFVSSVVFGSLNAQIIDNEKLNNSSIEVDSYRNGIFLFDAKRDSACVRECLTSDYFSLVTAKDVSEEQKAKDIDYCVEECVLSWKNVLVYRKDGKTVGYIHYSLYDSLFLGSSGMIIRLAVLKEYRGQGIARELIKKVEGILSQDVNLTDVVLRTTGNHLDDFYKKLGYSKSFDFSGSYFRKQVRYLGQRTKIYIALSACYIIAYKAGYLS